MSLVLLEYTRLYHRLDWVVRPLDQSTGKPLVDLKLHRILGDNYLKKLVSESIEFSIEVDTGRVSGNLFF